MNLAAFLLVTVCLMQLSTMWVSGEKADRAEVEELEGLEKRFGAVPMGFMDKRFGAVPMGFMDKKSGAEEKRFGAIPMGFIDKKNRYSGGRANSLRRYGKRSDEDSEYEKK